MRRVAAAFFLIAVAVRVPASPAPAANADRDWTAAYKTVTNMLGDKGVASHWKCATTQSSGLILEEYDTIERMGASWVHGRARPTETALPNSEGYKQPYYDYYLGFVGTHWVYIQIAPAQKIFFVGVSDGPDIQTKWSIVYPYKLSGYTLTLTSQTGFSIDFPDLRQYCQKDVYATPAAQPSATPAPLPLECHTYDLEKNLLTEQSFVESVSITKPEPRTAWWQGSATIQGRADPVYEYNLFQIGNERISVLINPSANVYAVARSHATPNLNTSVWVVRYPSVEAGFAFNHVTYITNDPDERDVPNAFVLIFKDGYQTCAQHGATKPPID